MYEQGNSEPNVETLCKIATFFGVTIDYLTGLSNVKSKNIDITFIANYLGLTEHAINEIHSFYEYAKMDEIRMKQIMETLNMLFAPGCDFLQLISRYIHFSATHFRKYDDENQTPLIPISELALWDDISKTSYSEDWDLWSNALLLLAVKELEYLHNEKRKELFAKFSQPK